MTRRAYPSNSLPRSPLSRFGRRQQDCDYLDNSVCVPSESDKADLITHELCPVQVHKVPGQSSSMDYFFQDNDDVDLLNLDSDDDNILDDNCILIDDSSISINSTPQRSLYPDANSHSNYNLTMENVVFNSPKSFPSGNHQRSNYHETNSHANYDILHNVRKNVRTNEGSPAYSIASHRAGRAGATNKNLIEEKFNKKYWSPFKSIKDEANYEVANSHSNYQIFHNTRLDTETNNITSWTEDSKLLRTDDNREQVEEVERQSVTSPSKSESSAKSTESSTTCDIEECLMQIEESLLNIEKNLLHVQDLDIPELKHILYKSPSVERSLFEVQDLLCSESSASMMISKLFRSASEDQLQVLQNLVQDMASKNSVNSDDNSLTNENLSPLANDPCVEQNLSYDNVDKNINFLLSNREVTTENEETTSIDQELSEFMQIEKDLSANNCDSSSLVDDECKQRNKFHSRTNSLDEGSIYTEPSDRRERRKTSLANLFSTPLEQRLDSNGKTKSDDTLEKSTSDIVKGRRNSRDDRLASVEAKALEFRRMIEEIISKRKLNPRGNPESSEVKSLNKVPGPREFRHLQTKKSTGCDKRKRKKAPSRVQSTEKALVSNKLISLSLSLLLAALLQAVRCLTDLVEDAFRSVSYERSGLFQ